MIVERLPSRIAEELTACFYGVDQTTVMELFLSLKMMVNDVVVLGHRFSIRIKYYHQLQQIVIL